MTEFHLMNLDHALETLHAPDTEPSERSLMGNYLASFQKSLLAWNVVTSVLGRPQSAQGLTMFASQTLSGKLRRQAWQLNTVRALFVL